MTRSSALQEAEREVAHLAPFLSALGWAPFIAECMWIVDQLDDVESDLSAFHRIDDYRTMHSVRFFSLALRLGAYAGAVQARELMRQQAEKPRQGSGTASDPKVVDDSVAMAELASAGLLEREVA